MVILDTSVIIDHLRQGGDSLLLRLAQTELKENLGMSIISIQELYEGRSTLDEEKERMLLSVISPLKILPYSYEIAQKAGEIARDLPQVIELADAAIAATAIIHSSQLFTLNIKDFKQIPSLDLYKLS